MTEPTITPTSKKMVTIGNPSGEKGEAVAPGIVERLRDLETRFKGFHLAEAADEIGRMQRQLDDAGRLLNKRAERMNGLTERARNAALEEAATVAEDNNSWPREGEEIAAAIRALKEKGVG